MITIYHSPMAEGLDLVIVRFSADPATRKRLAAEIYRLLQREDVSAEIIMGLSDEPLSGAGDDLTEVWSNPVIKR